MQTSAAVVNVFVDTAMWADPPSADRGRMKQCLTPALAACRAADRDHLEEQDEVREFTAINRFDVEFFTEGCRRYSIRRLPGFGTAASATVEVAARGLAGNWLATLCCSRTSTTQLPPVSSAASVTAMLWTSASGASFRRLRHDVYISYRQSPLSICRAIRRTQERTTLHQPAHGKEEPPESQLNLSEDEMLVAARALARASAQSGLALEFGMLLCRVAYALTSSTRPS